MASRISFVPTPVLAEARMHCAAGSPITRSISPATTSGWALGRSILLITGMMARSCSRAW